MTSHSYFLVESASQALRIEKTLQTVDIPCKLVPVPRRLSTDCGFSVRIESIDSKAAIAALREKQVPFHELAQD